MPTDSADDEDDSLLNRWGDLEHPFGDPEESDLVSGPTQASDYEPDEPTVEELSGDLSEVDSDLLNTFAVCVLLANLGVLLISVGFLLVVFRDMLQLGGGLFVIGSLTLFRLRQYYRSYIYDHEADSEVAADTDSAPGSETAADGNLPPESEPTESGHNR